MLVNVLTRTGTPATPLTIGARKSLIVAFLTMADASNTGAGNGCPLLSLVTPSLLKVPVSNAGSRMNGFGAGGGPAWMTTVNGVLDAPTLPARSVCWTVY